MKKKILLMFMICFLFILCGTVAFAAGKTCPSCGGISTSVIPLSDKHIFVCGSCKGQFGLEDHDLDYIRKSSTEHTEDCTICNYAMDKTHTWYYGHNISCRYCGYKKAVNSGHAAGGPCVSNNSGKHNEYCILYDDCTFSYALTPCYDNDNDLKCDACGYQIALDNSEPTTEVDLTLDGAHYGLKNTTNKPLTVNVRIYSAIRSSTYFDNGRVVVFNDTIPAGVTRYYIAHIYQWNNPGNTIFFGYVDDDGTSGNTYAIVAEAKASGNTSLSSSTTYAPYINKTGSIQNWVKNKSAAATNFTKITMSRKPAISQASYIYTPLQDNSSKYDSLINTAFSYHARYQYTATATSYGHIELRYTLDTTKPTVALNGTASPLYANSNSTISIPVKFSDPGNQYTSSGINKNTVVETSLNVTLGDIYKTQSVTMIEDEATDANPCYIINMTGITGNGPLKISFPAGSFADKTGNTNNKIDIDTGVTIDNTAPTTPTITGTKSSETGSAYTSGAWTNTDVYLHLSSTDASSGVSYYEWKEGTNGVWTSCNNPAFFEANRNETQYFRAIDKVGNISSEGSFKVCIDKTSPTMNSLTADSTTWAGSNITITGKATDSGSGIVAYAFAKGSATPSYTTITATTSQITQTYTATGPGTYYFYVKDQVGNVNSTSVTINSGTISGSVSISGTATYGSKLSSTLSSVSPSDATKTYQWYSNTTNSTSGGTAIDGKTSSTYTMTSEAFEKYIYLVVTVSKSGYTTKTLTSNVIGPIGKRPLTVTSKDASKVYDGTALTGETAYELTSGTISVSSHKLVVSPVSSITDAGSITNEISAKVTNSSDSDMKKYYNVTVVNSGTLTVTKANATKPTLSNTTATYDGKSHYVGVSGGSGGTIYYSKSIDGQQTWSAWQASNWPRVSAGTTYIKAYVKGDANHNDTGETSVASITINKAAGSISYATTTVNKTYGDEAFTNTLTHVGDGTVTYKSSDTTVATVDSAGKVTIVKAGTATITATVSGGSNYSYATTTASYTLNVAKATPSAITLSSSALTFACNGAAQTVTVTRTGNGTVSATSSNTSAATVSVSGTKITVKPGTAGEAAISSTITVKVAEGTNHTAPSNKTFTATVSAHNYSGACSICGTTGVICSVCGGTKGHDCSGNYETGGKYYETLATAVSAATDGGTIKVLKSGFTDSSTVTISKTITLNTNGQTFTRTGSAITINYGHTLNIIGSGKITSPITGNYPIRLEGTLNLTDATLEWTGDDNGYSVVRIGEQAVFNMNSGTVKGTYHGVRVNGTFNMHAGTVETNVNSSIAAIAITQHGDTVPTINITGGTIKSTNTIGNATAIQVGASGAKIDISNAELIATGKAEAYGIYNYGATELTTNGRLTISENTTITATGNGTWAEGVHVVMNFEIDSGFYATVENTTINVSAPSGVATGVRYIGTATAGTETINPLITITDSNITATSGGDGKGIFAENASGQIIVRNGTITADGSGIEMNNSGSVVLGYKQAGVSRTAPVIKGDTYGISSTGAPIYFYDGIVKAKTKANVISGATSNVESGYSIVNNTETISGTTYHNAYLKLTPSLSGTAVSVKEGASNTQTYTYNGDGTVTASSSSTSIATVSINASTKQLTVTGVARGTATITLTATEGSTYAPKTATFTVTVTDGIAPTKPTFVIKYNDDNTTHKNGNWTNRQVYTTISSRDAVGVTEFQYSKDNGSTWTKLGLGASSNKITANGTTYSGSEHWSLWETDREQTIYFRAKDAAGNYSAMSDAYYVKYDVTAPTAPTFKIRFADTETEHTNGNWTNKRVVTDISSSDAVGVAEMYYSFDEGATWSKLNFGESGNKMTVSGTKYTGTESWGLTNRNQTVRFRAKDTVGNYSSMSEKYYVKYDVDAPVITLTSTNNTNSVSLSAAITDTNYGVIGYAWTNSSSVPTTWTDITQTTSTTQTKDVTSANNWYIWVKDVAGNTTVKNVTTYSVAYNANNGSGAPSTQYKANGVALTLSSTVPTRTNYNFVGWNTAADGSGTSYVKGASYTANASTTLYAQWSAATAGLTVNPNNGSWNGTTSNSTITGNAASTIAIADPIRAGYKFNGWTLSGGGTLNEKAMYGYRATNHATLSVNGNNDLVVTSSGNDPQVRIDTNFNASQVKKVRITLGSVPAAGTFQIFFSTGGSLSEDNSSRTSYSSGSADKTIVVDFSSVAGWTGNVNYLRLDPGGATGDYTIKKIEYLDASNNVVLIHDDFSEKGYTYTYGSSAGTLTANWTEANYSVGDEYYSTLATAYAAIGTSGTIKVEKNNTDTSEFDIASGKNITLDTNGKTITKNTQIFVRENGILNIIGTGEITSSYQYSFIRNYGTLNITSATISETSTLGNGEAIWNYSIVNINSGTISAFLSGIVNEGTVYMKGGNVVTLGTDSLSAINNYDNSIFNMTGGTITAAGYGTSSTETGIITITGGTIIGDEYGISSSGTITITGGTIISTGGRAVRKISSNGALTIGTQGGGVSRTSPVLISETSIRSEGTFKFYDGIIKGKTDAIDTSTVVPEVESGYEIVNNTETIDSVVYKTAYLKLTPTLSAPDVTVNYNASTTVTATYVGDGTLSATSANTGIATATISNKTITITGVKAGSTTVTVTATEGTNYAPKTITFNVTVAKIPGSISYATKSITKSMGDANFTNALTQTGDGTVTYSSSNTGVATVNSSTGEVTIKGIGTTTITATVTDGTNYTYSTKTATYTVTVNDLPGITITEIATNNVDWEGWTLSGGATINSSNELVLSTAGQSATKIFLVDEAKWTIGINAMATSNTDSRGIMVSSAYYDENFASKVSQNTYSGNGWAPTMPYNSYLYNTWDGWAGYGDGVKYVQITISYNASYSTSGFKVKEVTFSSEIDENYVGARIRASVASGSISSIKYLWTTASSGVTAAQVTTEATNGSVVYPTYGTKGTYYLWVLATNANGGQTLQRSDAYTIDNPEIELVQASGTGKSKVVNAFIFNQENKRAWSFFANNGGTIEEITSNYYGSDAYYLVKNGTGNQYHGQQPRAAALTNAAAGTYVIISANYNTTAPAGHTSFLTSGLYTSDWKTQYSTSVVATDLVINADGNDHHAFGIIKTNEALGTTPIVTSAMPNWGYTTNSGSMEIDGSQFFVVTDFTDGIAVQKYAKGEQQIPYFRSNGTTFTGTSFTVTQNGTYTVYTKTTNGVERIRTINVTGVEENYSVNGEFYPTLATAYAAAGTTGTITVVNSNTDSSTFTVENGKTITLDLNGKVITKTSSSVTVNAGGSLIINGSTGTLQTAVDGTNTLTNLISNSGTLTVNGGTIHNAGRSSGYWYTISAPTGTTNIKGGTIKASGEDVTVNGTTYNARAIYTTTGTVNISGGTVESSKYGIHIWASSGTVNVTGGTINAGYQGINISGSNSSAKLNVTGGTIISTGGVGASVSTTGTVTIGTSGSGVSRTSPVIQGTTYGLQASNGFKFYDGILKGKTAGYSGTPTPESGYEVLTGTEGDYKTAYLKLTPTLTVSPTSVSVVAGSTATATITYNGDGTLSAVSNDTSKATVSLSGKTLTITGVKSGSTSITITATEGTDYAPKTITLPITGTPQAPTKPTITVKDANGTTISSGNWANKDLTITLSGSTLTADGSVVYQYRINGGTWTNYSSAITFDTETSGTTIEARAYNSLSSSVVSSTTSYTIKLDKTAPVITGITTDPTGWTTGNVTLKFSATDNLSGVNGYVQSVWGTGNLSSTYKGITASTNVSNQTFATYDYNRKTVTLRIKDQAGNTADATKDINTIDRTAPIITNGVSHTAQEYYNNASKGTMQHSTTGFASAPSAYQGGTTAVTTVNDGTVNSSQVLKITHATSKTTSGYNRSIKYEASKVYVRKIYAKIPTGYTLNIKGNTASGTRTNITSSFAGTGAWKEYSYVYVMNDNAASTMTYGHAYIEGAAPSSAFEWYVATDIIYDVTNIFDDVTTAYSGSNATMTITAKDTQSGTASITVNGTAQTLTTSGTSKVATYNVSSAGTYTIVATDALGNATTLTKTATTITYNGNGSTSGSTASQIKINGADIALRSNGFAKTNYVFTGWNTAANGSGTSYAAGATYTGDANVTFYAQWTVDTASLTVNPNGGSYNGITGTTTTTGNSGSTIKVPAPVRAGYKFDGWTLTGGGTLNTVNYAGYGSPNTYTTLALEGNDLKITATNGDPYFYLDTNFSASTVKKIRLTYTSTSATSPQIFFSTGSSMVEPNSVSGSSPTVGVDTTTTFDFSSNAGWTGIITQLRFDPGRAAGTYVFKKVEFLDASNNVVLIHDDFSEKGYTYTYGTSAGTLTANWIEANYSVGDKYYPTLATAYAAIGTTGTIKVENSNTDSSNITIASEKDITIDTNGKTIIRTLDIHNNGTLTVEGNGTIIGTGEYTYLIRNYSTGTVNIQNVTLKCNSIVVDSDGIANINSGALLESEAGPAVRCLGTGTFNVDGGNLIAKNHVGIDNNNEGTVNIYSGSIISENSNAILNRSTGKINIIGGTISSTNIAVFSYTDGGKVKIGNDDGTVSRTVPVIIGTSNAVRVDGSNSIFEFYDGILKGISGTISSSGTTTVPTGYEIVNGTDGDYKTAYLKQTASLSVADVSVNYGASTTVTATYVGDGTLSATSANTGIATVSVSGNTITVNGVQAGSTTVTVTASEGSEYAPKSVTFNVTVDKIANTLTVTGKTGLTYTGGAQNLVTASNAQGDVYYAIGTELTGSNYSTAGNKTVPTGTAAGNYTVYYYTPGNTNYLAKSGNVTVTIATASMPGGVTISATQLQYGGTASAALSGTPTGAKITSYKWYSNTSNSTSGGTQIGTGKTLKFNSKAYNKYIYLVVTVTADNYSEATFTSNVIGKMAKRDVTITTGSATKVYDGTALTNNTYTILDVDGDNTLPFDEHTITVTPTGTITNVGTAQNTATVVILSSSNSDITDDYYNVTIVPGTLTVTRKSIDLPSANTGLVYNGRVQTGVTTNSTFTATGNTGTNAGSYTATVTPTGNYQWSDGTTTGKSVTWSIGQYNLSNATIANVANQSYTGTAIKPTPAVTVPLPSGSTTTVTSEVDYTYSNNTTVGTATLTVTAKSTSTNYIGSKSTTFNIVDTAKPTTTVTVDNGNDGSWTNNNATLNVTGTDNFAVDKIQYSTNNSTWTTLVTGGTSGDAESVNLLKNSDFSSTSTVHPGWDESLNGTTQASYWETGYNSGVQLPLVGYHAHVNTTDFDFNVIKFANLNNQFSTNDTSCKNRWLGITYKFDKENNPIKSNTTYTLSYDLYGDTVGVGAELGLRYSLTDGTAENFHNGRQRRTITAEEVGKWTRVTYTFTTDELLDTANRAVLYIYGHCGVEGTSYVKNVQLEEGSTATVWTPNAADQSSTTLKGTVVVDEDFSGTYYFKTLDKEGNVSEIVSKAVNVDKSVPSVTVAEVTYGQNATIKLKDTLSGIRYFAVTKNTTVPTTTGTTDVTTGNQLAYWYPVANSTSEKSVTFSGLAAGTYYAWGKDLAGNYKYTSFTVNRATGTVTAAISGTPTVGQTLTATGTTSSNGTKTYQWWTSDSATATSGTAIPSATSSTYTIKSDVAGKYIGVTVSVAQGSNYTECSDTAITTTKASDTEVSVTTHPSNVKVKAGSTATFTVAGSGTNLKYQWQISTDGGSTFTNINNATSATYTTAATTSSMNGYQYRCIITNNTGNATSNAATLTVYYAPTIKTQPANVAVTYPNKATFTIAANAGNPSTTTYQWQLSTDGGSTWNNITNATGVSYTTAATTVAMSGYKYRCVISNAQYSNAATSNAATLTVNRATGTVTAAISGTPTVGQTLTATGTTSSNGTKTYQWWTSDSATATSGIAITGETGETYTITADVAGKYIGVTVSVAQGSNYTACSDTAITTTKASDIEVSVTTHPSNVKVKAGSTATFTVAGSGTNLKYQWQISTDGGSTFTNINNATSATYTTAATTSSMNGYQYRCIITNNTGSATSNAATLTVYYAPTIKTQPANVAVTYPNKATFTIAANTGNPSATTYQWQLSTDGGNTWNNITNATGVSYTTGATTVAMSGYKYRCVISNAQYENAATSNAATLTVNAKTVSGLTITLNPTSYVYDGTAKTPAVTVKDGVTTLTVGTDYTVSYSNNTNVGTGKVTITGKGNYTGTKDATFAITHDVVTAPTAPTDKVFNGATQNSGITTPANATVVTASSTTSAKDVGTYTVVYALTDTSNYTWSDGSITNKSVTWKITPYNLSNATIANITDQSYTGSAIIPELTATVPLPSGSTTALVKGTDYTVSATNNTVVGTATATITGRGNYTGTKSATFKIVPDTSVTLEVIVSNDNFVYTGSALVPSSVVVKANGVTLTKDTDYTLSYSDNVNAGTVTVTATGKGNHAGNKGTATYKIAKASPSLTVEPATVSLVKGHSTTVTITHNGNGALDVSSNTTGVATASLSGKTVTIDAVNAGTATVTVSLAEGANHTAANLTIAVTVATSNYSVNGVHYEKLAEAVAAISTTGTIVVEASNEDSSDVTIANTKNITIDTRDKTITKTAYGITNAGTLTIIGNGTITTSDTIQLIDDTGTINISGDCTLTKTNTSTTYNLIRSYGNINISNGTFTGQITVCGKIKVTGGTFSATNFPIGLQNDASGEIAGANISTDGYYAITHHSTGTLEIKEGTTITATTGTGILIGSKSGTLNVNGGTIIASGTAISNSAEGKVIIGSNDGNVSRTVPTIRGNTAYYANTADSTLAFYDGILQAKSFVFNASSGVTVTPIVPDGYEVCYGTTSIDGATYKTAYLKQIPTLEVDDVTVTYGSTGDVTVTYNGDGAITATSGDTNMATVQSVNSTTKKITIKGVKVGTATITVKVAEGSEHAPAETTFNVTVTEKSLANVTSTITTTTHTYDGTAKTQTITLKDGTYTLVEGTDYTVSYTNNTNAGTATVTVTGMGNYTGTLTESFTINKATPTVTVPTEDGSIRINTNGSAYITSDVAGKVSVTSGDVSKVIITNGDGAVTEGGEDGVVQIGYKGVSVGNDVVITVVFTPTDTTNYESVTKTFKVDVRDRDLPTLTVTPTNGTVNYQGTNTFNVTASVAGEITVVSGSTTYVGIVSGDGASVTANTASTVTYEGLKATTSEVPIIVTFTPTDTTNYTEATAIYTVKGVKQITPTLSATPNNITLTVGESGEITITSNGDGTIGATVDKGNIAEVATSGNKVTVTGKGKGTATISVTISAGTNYSASTITVPVTVNAKDLNSSDITAELNETTYAYDGTDKEPTATVKDGEKLLVQNTDYVITYENNRNVGTATAIITGSGNYTGVIRRDFSIIDTGAPTKPAITAKVDNYSGATYVEGTFVNKNIVIEVTSTDVTGVTLYEWSTNPESGFTSEGLTMVDGGARIRFENEMNQTIYFRAKDGFDNYSEVSSITLIIDKTAPSGSIDIRAIYVENETEFTNNNTVVIDVTATDNMSEPENLKIALINEDEFSVDNLNSDISWMNYEAVKSWDTSDGDGLKRVYIIVKDEAGNQSFYLAEE